GGRGGEQGEGAAERGMVLYLQWLAHGDRGGRARIGPEVAADPAGALEGRAAGDADAAAGAVGQEQVAALYVGQAGVGVPSGQSQGTRAGLDQAARAMDVVAEHVAAVRHVGGEIAHERAG